MNPSATYDVHHGRWLATLAIGLLVLAVAYSRTPTPAWTGQLPLPDTAQTGGERSSSYNQVLTAENPSLLLVGDSPSLPPTSAWYPVAQWLAAGAGPSKLATRLPQAGWPLASQADTDRHQRRP